MDAKMSAHFENTPPQPTRHTALASHISTKKALPRAHAPPSTKAQKNDTAMACH